MRMKAPWDISQPLHGHVLVVDDEERNQRLLKDLLEVQGHRVTLAADGEEALDKARQDAPDVVLLDVMLPKMNGFDACRALKSSPSTAGIPVIMVTSLASREDRLRGMESGADDFLTKPIDIQEVALRTRNAIYSRQMHDVAQRNYEHLLEMEQLRDNLVHMVVHDMRSPLMVVSWALDLLGDELGGALTDETREVVASAELQAHLLTEMLDSVLDVSRLEAGAIPLSYGVVDLNALVRQVVEPLGRVSGENRLRVETDDGPRHVACDRVLIRRVVINLVNNAMRHSPSGGAVRVAVEGDGDVARISVSDDGPGLPPEHRKRVFDKFWQAANRKGGSSGGTGLGLTFCKMAVERHGGEIGVDSEPGAGSTFWFRLPVAPPEEVTAREAAASAAS
jgi:signal transduction histidine kinase